MVLDERHRIQQNLRTIRGYLINGFPGFQLTEDAPDPTICHRFTMTDVKTFEQYKLKVGWPRLSEITSNPEKMDRLLMDDHGDRKQALNQIAVFSLLTASTMAA